MTTKVIYVAIVRLTDKMAVDWHIDYLIERGVSVEYWDIVGLVREQHSERGARSPAWLHVFNSFAEVEERLRLPENRDAFYVMLVSYTGRLSRIFRLLSRYDCRMVKFASGALPQDPAFKWRKVAAWLAAPVRCANEIVNRLKASALRRMKLVKPFAITFAAGQVPMGGGNYSARVVPINFFDYDRYMEVRAAAGRRLVPERYAVFLDSNLPHHSDLELCGVRPIDAVGYYRSLNRFFGLLEQHHGIRVVIAAHPRANYDESLFEGRAIYRLATAELVQDTEFVLAHTSTSMSYAVLNGKPLIFIYTAGMAAAYDKWLLREMRCFADYLDVPVYNVDEVREGREVELRQANRARYEHYKYNFLTSPQSEDVPTREIVWRELQARSY